MSCQLEDLFRRGFKQIWAGDFNALTKEDYDTDRWNHIATVRETNSWESPRTELTNKVSLCQVPLLLLPLPIGAFPFEQVKSRGFRDCWSLFGQPDPIKTCRFDTRIDYIFASDAVLAEHPLFGVKHIDDDASDHNMVIAEFINRKKRDRQ